MSIAISSDRSRLKRPAMLISAGLIAAALAVAGPLAANAANAPSISLSASTVTVYGNVQVNAEGFQAGEELTFSLDSTVQDTETADSDGHVVGFVYVPAGTSMGTHTVHVKGTTTADQTADINVVASPTLTLSASTVTFSQLNGSGITATVTGFTPGESVQFGYSTGNSGSDVGDPIVVGSDGVATTTLTSDVLFGAPTTAARTIDVSAGNAAGNVRSTIVTLDIVADASPSAPAAPAVPVKANASFTG